MSMTASSLAALEAQPDAKQRSKLLAHCMGNGELMDYFHRVFDPFKQYGFTASPDISLQAIVTSEAVRESFMKGWPYWCEVLDCLEKGELPEDVLQEWENEAAWPIYQRVLHKRMQHLTVEDVNSKWGLIPEFLAGKTVEGPIDCFPVFVEPVYHGVRRLVMVSRPFGDFASPVTVFTSDGRVCGTSFPDELREAISTLRYGTWLTDEQEFKGGLVFDGVMRFRKDAPKLYTIFDVKPLKYFKDAKYYKSYEKRRCLLSRLKDYITSGDPVHVIHAIRCDDADMLATVWRELAEDKTHRRIRGAIVKPLAFGYPHKQKQNWTVLKV